ncbi:MAG: hypothetical protein RJA70_1343 [Pseudomonadota bacterium]|jgi:HEAT repeat protein
MDADGDFKRGTGKPVVIVGVVLGLAAITTALVSLGVEKDAERMTADQAALEEKRILVLPASEQIGEFRKYAASQTSSHLKEESLKRLAWAGDPAGVELAIAALKDPEQKVRSMAATALSHFGLPAAEKAKPALLQALTEAGPESRPQIAWALVILKEPAAFDEILKLYRSGELSGVQRLGGGRAFQPERLVDLVSVDQLAALHKDDSPAVRQLVATVLSRLGDGKYTDTLISLVQDQDKTVAYQAAPGLGKVNDKRALDALIAAMKGLVGDERQAYLEAVRDGAGTSGLVAALGAVSAETKTIEWHQTEQIFGLIDKMADPTGSDALAAYVANGNPGPHWSYRAGKALASVGDLRGVAPLATRLRQDSQKIYTDDTDYEQLLKRDNKEQVVAARMIADLAVLNPDKSEQIRVESEDALWSWLTARKVPSANGLRALTKIASTLHHKQMKAWANPTNPLPLMGQQPPMPDEWVIAQSALRFLGALKQEESWDVLEKQLKRRPLDLDISQDALYGGGLAILGMTLKALGHGAADGINEWGDNRGFEPLLKFAENMKEHESARERACMALATVATDENMIKIAEKIQEYGGDDKKQQTIRACFLETLVRRPVPGTANALLPQLKGATDLTLRHQVARAIGKAGLSPEVEAQLFEMIKDEVLRLDAVLALMLGGNAETAARALASLADAPRADIDELQEMWFDSFGYWTIDDLEQGHVARYVDNAAAARRVEFKDSPQDWVGVQLMRQFDNLVFDNGPHSFTRVVLRGRLFQMAQGSDTKLAASAVRILHFMGEQGVLYALRDSKGPIASLAAQAYHELVNPLLTADVRLIQRDKSEDE